MSKKIYDGGQAFPIPSGEGNNISYGMSLRDYFAAIALTGAANECSVNGSEHAKAEIRRLATAAYLLADAMITHKKETE